MGLNRKQWVFTEKHFKNLLNGEYAGKKMLELGCQEIKHGLLRRLEREGTLDKKKRSRAAKVFFELLGFKVTSVDKMKCLRAQKMDLRRPFPEDFINQFDVVTNYGTTEHVSPPRYQYQVFKNIHDSLKVGGIFIHIVPGYKARTSHSKINYGKKFFSSLAKSNDYRVIEIDNEFNRGAKLCMAAICLVKDKDVPFFDNEENFLKHIIVLDTKTLKKYKKFKKNPLW